MRVYRWKISWKDEASDRITDHAMSGIWVSRAVNEDEATLEIIDFLNGEAGVMPDEVYGFSVVEDESGRLE